jgi:hypothetical protein
MRTALIDLAHLSATISTSHYLYLNEAMRSVVENGTAPKMAGDLSGIEGHDAVLRDCHLPPCAQPQDLLFHLSQTTPYHRALARDARMAMRVLKAVFHRSELPFGQLTITTDPVAQASTYDPAEFDAPRALAQIYSALWCVTRWGKLPAMEDDFTNLMDLLQGHFHILYSGLMVYGAIEQGDIDGRDVRNYGMPWHNLMSSYVLKMMPTAVDFVAAHTAGFQEVSYKQAIHPGEPMAAISGDALQQFMGLVAGLDLGLAILHERLSHWNGQLLLELAERVQDVRVEHTKPFVARLRAITEEGPEPGRA